MIDPKSFEIPLEKQLKMRLVDDEINSCTDVKVLQENLKAMADQLMKYQHLLSQILKQQLMSELEKWDSEASKIVKEALEREQHGPATGKQD